MGGTGGLFEGYTPGKYRDVIQEARNNTRDIQFETNVNGIIFEILGDYQRDTEITNEHLELLKNIITEDDIGTIEMRFGGSVKRHTYVDGLSDVDVLIIINKTDLIEKNPKEVLEYINNKIFQSNPKNISDVRIGDLAVTVEFKDGEEIQLLPALKWEDGFRIPKIKENKWSNIIRPNKFAQKLTEVNKECNNNVVPVIKLAKGIMSTLPQEQHLQGYHMDSLAIRIFSNYSDTELSKTPKAMLRYFFENVKHHIQTPIVDKTNQSIHVDDYLGPGYSEKRYRLGYAFERIGRRMKDADEIGSIEEWEAILDYEKK